MVTPNFEFNTKALSNLTIDSNKQELPFENTLAQSVIEQSFISKKFGTPGTTGIDEVSFNYLSIPLNETSNNNDQSRFFRFNTLIVEGIILRENLISNSPSTYSNFQFKHFYVKDFQISSPNEASTVEFYSVSTPSPNSTSTNINLNAAPLTSNAITNPSIHPIEYSNSTINAYLTVRANINIVVKGTYLLM